MTDIATTAPDPASPRVPGWQLPFRRGADLLRQTEVDLRLFGMVAALFAILIGIELASDKAFLTPVGLLNLSVQASPVAIIATGMVLIIVTRNIDLSVGSVVGVVSMTIAVLFYTVFPGTIGVDSQFGWLIALAVGLGVGALIGGFHGFLIAYVGMPPFVVTLGMMSVARSLAMVLSGNQMVYQFGIDHAKLVALGGGSTRGWFLWLAGATGEDSTLGQGFFRLAEFVNIPNPAIFLALLALLFGFRFRWSKWGRHIFAIGGNEHAATLTGVPVRRIKVGVYMLSALMAGLAGILQVGWLGTITTGMGTGMELIVIAAVVIGGANLVGGAGTAFGAVVGAVLIEMIRNSLTLLGINPFWQGTFVGTFIIIAVLFDRVRDNKQAIVDWTRPLLRLRREAAEPV